MKLLENFWIPRAGLMGLVGLVGLVGLLHQMVLVSLVGFSNGSVL